MENASKALIIAGAILISILLISVGIIIMNAINEPVQQGASAADSQAIEIFNSKFTSYAGEQKGTTVRQLISTVRSMNGANSSNKVNINSEVADGAAADGTVNMSLADVDSSATYTVDFDFADSGYIENITIEE